MTETDLTPETLVRMGREVVGVPLSLEDAQAILPYVRGYLETARDLEQLLATFDDPRAMAFAEDARLAP